MTEQQDNSARRFELEGHDLGYPTDFRDGSSTLGIFAVSAQVANKLIADSGFEVANIAPGKAALSMSCVHYTDTDCGVYEEIALAFFVRPTGRQKRLQIPYLSTWIDIIRGNIASYTWGLPVSSTLARDCGIYMWGFPKTLETIEYDDSNQQAKSSWLVDGNVVLSYSVAAKGEKDMPLVSPPVYSVFEGRQHVSYLSQTYRNSSIVAGGGELILGDHPMADKLRALGLPKKPLIAGFNGHLKFEMSHPEPL